MEERVVDERGGRREDRKKMGGCRRQAGELEGERGASA